MPSWGEMRIFSGVMISTGAGETISVFAGSTAVLVGLVSVAATNVGVAISAG